MLCCVVLCCVVLCCAVLCSAVLCCSVLLFCSVLCSAVLCSAVLCYVLLCCAVLCVFDRQKECLRSVEIEINDRYNDINSQWDICMMTSFDYKYQNAEASYCIQYFFFCEESLVRDTNLHNKDCSEMHSGR